LAQTPNKGKKRRKEMARTDEWLPTLGKKKTKKKTNPNHGGEQCTEIPKESVDLVVTGESHGKARWRRKLGSQNRTSKQKKKRKKKKGGVKKQNRARSRGRKKKKAEPTTGKNNPLRRMRQSGKGPKQRMDANENGGPCHGKEREIQESKKVGLAESGYPEKKKTQGRPWDPRSKKKTPKNYKTKDIHDGVSENNLRKRQEGHCGGSTPNWVK